MPSPQGKETNKFRCEGCGRYLNTEAELKEHQRDCLAALQSGQPNKPKAKPDDEDREWVSTP